MKKIIFSLIFILFLVLSAFAQNKTLIQNKNASSLVVITSGTAAVGYGLFVSKDLLITTINCIGNYKSAQILVGGKYIDVLGFVSSDLENDLVLLKVDYKSNDSIILNSKIPEAGQKVLLTDKNSENKLTLIEASLKDNKNFGEVKLFSFDSQEQLKNSGLPVYDASGDVIGLTVSPLVDDPGVNFAITAEILQKLIANQGDLRKLYLLMPAFEEIKKRSLANMDKSKAVTEFLDQGIKRYELRDYKGAIEKYNMVLRISPNDADALVLRGQAKYRLMLYKDAIEDFDKAINLQPEYAEAYDLRGLCKAELGDNEGACDDWKTSFEKGYDPAFKLLENFCDLEELK